MPIFENNCPKIIKETFGFPEFVSAGKKSTQIKYSLLRYKFYQSMN